MQITQIYKVDKLNLVSGKCSLECKNFFYLPVAEKTDRMRFVLWKSPDPLVVKINIDGASKANPGEAGVGGIFRNSNGELILGFASYLDLATTNYAEAKAICLILYFAKNMGLTKIWIESDSEILVQCLNGESLPP